MGVPKFYRWISERYPCLSEVVKEYQIPEFDNLYLDMNGIIHVCSHPNDNDPHFRMTEEKMFRDIFHYIEVLFRLIQPRNVFFMAVDGVAPRAKMNQQRGRRFRSAREAVDAEKKARDRGETLPTEERFDSNCITPGTEFMARLDTHLQYFVTQKISQDHMWQNCKVIYSGHETPGEGEHKIMEYIRYTKSQPNYNPNTRHCLYGLDADLMMLGLTSHEPHFSLLREEVRFGGKNNNSRTPTAEETTFHLLHLSLMREYIGYEFSELKSTLPFPYDLENIIDDWVLMGFLVGNDFIPHLPNLHINKEALPILYHTYKSVLPTLDGYLNKGGTLHLGRFEKFIGKLAEMELDQFHDTNADLQYFNSKKSKDGSAFKVNKGNGKSKKLEAFDFGEDGGLEMDEGCLEENYRDKFERLGIEDPNMDFYSDEEEESESASPDKRIGTIDEEFRQHKREYYMTKMNYQRVNSDVLYEQATCYVRGIQWILHYYYNGICSWSWYYPHHYSPYISDIKGFSNMKLDFDMGRPFMPYEQLLAVLPPLSKKHLPEAYRGLMTKENSPLKEYYPETFLTDLNGKQQDWEAVVLIPFIDENKLLRAMAPCNEQLTPDQKKRNIHGPMYIYSFTPDNLGEYKAPPHFPSIGVNHATLELVYRDKWAMLPEKIYKGLCNHVKQELYFVGFPTLKHIPHEFHVGKENVKVFQQNSRGDNFILDVKENEDPPNVKDLANRLLGKTVFIGWPHLVEAKVKSVSTASVKFYRVKGELREQQLEPRQKDEFHLSKNSQTTEYHDRWGINVGEIEILVYTSIMTGRRYIPSSNSRISLEKMWSHIIQPVPYQTLVRDIAVYDPGYKQHLTLEEYFPTRTKVFMMGQPHYGAMGEVIEINPSHQGRIRVVMTVSGEPNFDVVKQKQDQLSVKYTTSYHTAQKVGISSHLLARITGTIFLAPPSGDNSGELEIRNKLNIGLNLKNNKRNEEVIGYTRKTTDSNYGQGGKTTWLYSPKTVDTILDYQKNFPEIFDHLATHVGERDIFFQDDIFGKENYQERVSELTKWLKDSDFAKAGRQKCGTPTLDEAVVSRLAEEVDKVSAVCAKAIKMQVRPHLLFKPNPLQGSTPPDPKVTFELFDRVTNCREGFSVPLGAKGTVIGIHPSEKVADILYDILFDETFPEGLTLYGPDTKNRCYRLHSSSILNITHGYRSQSIAEDDDSSNAGSKNNENAWNNYRSDHQSHRSHRHQGLDNQRSHWQQGSDHQNQGSHLLQGLDQPNQRSNKPQGENQGYPQYNNQMYQSPQQQMRTQGNNNQKAPKNSHGFDTTGSPQPPDPNQLPSPSGLYDGMVEIRSANEVECVVHGSYYALWSKILQQGITRSPGRNINCFCCIPRVIPGPKAFQLLIYIDVKKALEDGIRFFRVNERQVTCTGDKQGMIRPPYFIKVVDCESNSIIYPINQSSSVTSNSGAMPFGTNQPNHPGQGNVRAFGPQPTPPSGQGRGRALATAQPQGIRLYQNIWSQVQREDKEKESAELKPSQVLSQMLNITDEEPPVKSENGRTEVSVEDIFKGAMTASKPVQSQAHYEQSSADILSILSAASQAHQQSQNNAETRAQKAESPVKSAFVPTQVIRNRTPRKPKQGQSNEAPSSSPNSKTTTIEPSNSSAVESKIHPKQKQEQQQQQQQPQQQQQHQHTNGNKSKRKARNRLAVNFGQPLDEDT